MTTHIGQRLSFDGALCTVRYIGPLSGLKGEWLGVEWDNPSRGKHNGQHQGQQVFSCLSNSPTTASFIRPNRKSDPTRTLLEAIRHKYATPTRTNGDINSTSQGFVEISGKTVEEIGFDKIQQQISDLAELKVVLVDDLNIRGIAKTSSEIKVAQSQLSQICPSISELDVGWNPIELWQDVADMCMPLKRLAILKASGLRLRSFGTNIIPNEASPFKSIMELQLNESLVRPDQIIQLLSSSTSSLFPSLRTLSLSQNDLTSFQAETFSQSFESVTDLILENNRFCSLAPLPLLTAPFPAEQLNIINRLRSRGG
jgi:tubulin-specific chaperone E